MDQPINNLDQTSEPVLKKNVSSLVIVFFIVLFSCGAFLLGQYVEKNKNAATQVTVAPTAIPTTNPTADWKTYTSNKYKYSLKYPNNMGISNYSTDENLVLNDNTINQGHWLFEVSVTSNTQNLTADQIVTSNNPDAQIKDIIVNNIPGKERIEKNAGDYGNTVAIIIKNSNIYQFSGDSMKFMSDNLNTEFDQILSTFKFLP